MTEEFDKAAKEKLEKIPNDLYGFYENENVTVGEAKIQVADSDEEYFTWGREYSSCYLSSS